MDTQHHKKNPRGKVWLGAILLIIGFIALLKNLGLFIPGWILSWPMLLIGIGLLIGYRHNFRHTASIILIFVGTLFLAIRVIPGLEMHNFIWPMLFIGIGLYLLFGRRKSWNSKEWKTTEWDKRVDNENETPADVPPVAKEDYLDSVSIFGAVKKNVVSKNFKGGEIVTIMGGAEVNLSQSDFSGPIVLEVVQVFGGTKIIIPPHWKVSSEMAAVFGGIEDKRMLPPDTTLSDKILIIKGTSIFGGIEIRSF